MRFSGSVLAGPQRWEKGLFTRITGALHSGKHILPPIIEEKQRREQIQVLWREAKNEMWLVRHKHEEIPSDLPERETLSFEEAPVESAEIETKRIIHEMSLKPDVTYEDRFMHIARQGHDWSKPKNPKYPDLNKHLSLKMEKKNLIFKYPKPIERPNTWKEIPGFNK